MVPGLVVWIVASAVGVLFSWLGCRLAEGLFDIELNGYKYPERALVVTVASILGSGGFLGWEGAHNWPDWQPVSDLYTLALWFPLMAIPGMGAACAALYGAGKLVFSFGTVMNYVGKGLRRGAIGLKNLFKGEGKVASLAREVVSPASTVPPASMPPQISLLEQARVKFADVQYICNALRQQLKEGAAFDQVGTISAGIERVSAAIREDENKQSVVPMLISDYLIPIEQGLRLYDRLLKRNVNSAQSALQEMEEVTLPLMYAKVVDLYDQIHVGDIAQLSTVASTLEVARRLEVKLEAPAELNNTM
jgi:hypothetical protein